MAEVDDAVIDVVASEVINGCTITGDSDYSDKAVDPTSVEMRVKRKAKRLAKSLSRDSGIVNGHGGTATVVQLKRRWKNNRKSRNGFTKRGEIKKGGAGGKGVWGKLGEESDLDAAIDMKDPNYDSDLLDDDNIVLREITPESSDEDLKNSITFNILEYYEHGDTDEAAMTLSELNIVSKWHLITQVSVEVALEHKPSQREMTSILLSDLYGRLIKQKEIAQGFDVILGNLPDLILDTPDAPIVVGCFLARTIADDCLPPKIIDFFKEKNYSDLANQALIKAHNLLNIKHGLTRLDNVWGVGGSLRPVQYLVRQMNMLLDEYLCSGDLQEAIRCILELEVPHFHHELVYEAVVDVIEAMNTHTEISMCKLLKALYDAIIITPEMMNKGFDRVFDVLDDISIDVPLASAVLERFLDMCINAGFLEREVLRKIPTRASARKRYVSEGDGGRLKEA
ncbi:programmed cell death protein 4 [Aphis gossypii]|uniref:Programmed cell death protein 4 n=1 Tax=Aphis gossypii TaxID=80765 RepID=A0A9P0ITT1_APHGO|nr:programmed cell death protein 4 [Aphis gossypii]CAH1716409.1 unnamed protein product [Aphis gossypii]